MLYRANQAACEGDFETPLRLKIRPQIKAVSILDNPLTNDYNFSMYTIRQTPEFKDWLTNVKDGLTRRRLATRLRKAELGNLGDVKSVGEGVFEMREFFGPGWRMYYIQRGELLIVMLGGGDKSSQSADIAKAIELATNIEE